MNSKLYCPNQQCPFANAHILCASCCDGPDPTTDQKNCDGCSEECWKEVETTGVAGEACHCASTAVERGDMKEIRERHRKEGKMDFQNRVGSKPGSGGAASAQNEAIDRRERLRKLALETIDINKDPYFMKNHLGQYECKLCLTLHMNEGNYLAHIQGKRHQYNLGRRAAQEARDRDVLPQPVKQKIQVRKTIKIGRPGYRVTKQRDPETNQRSLIFQIDFPEIEEGLQPRHRFMSAYEQKVEAPDRDFQYVLFAAEPYETIAFKIPNKEIDKGQDKFYTDWDSTKQTFTLQFYFAEDSGDGPKPPGPPGPPPPEPPPPPPPM